MIRPYSEDDFETLCGIARRAWRKIFEGFRKQLGEDVYEILNPDAEHSKDRQLRAFADRTPENLLVAERNGKIVGFITFLLDREHCVGIIGNNAVDPLSAEKGVGQEMYQAAFERLRGAGMKLVQVTTGLDEGHAPARRAYERAGFKLRTEAVTYVKTL